MGTRAMVLFNESEGLYECYYRHNDGNPRSLGVQLLVALKSHLGKQEIVKFCDLKTVEIQNVRKMVAKPEDAFLKVQSDLEYIYAVEDLKSDYTTLRIYKTSDPYSFDGFPEFVWLIFFCYVKKFPVDVSVEMRDVERVSVTALKGLKAYHSALTQTNRKVLDLKEVT